MTSTSVPWQLVLWSSTEETEATIRTSLRQRPDLYLRGHQRLRQLASGPRGAEVRLSSVLDPIKRRMRDADVVAAELSRHERGYAHLSHTAYLSMKEWLEVAVNFFNLDSATWTR